ncbi:MAG: 1-deoxy-D-xylulose-5-phosphate synthase, partial [Clostridiales bacterium]|nr:1-deoxy-D-xylulose-5-phosphate synthase [Clostridiales bacterium]
MELLNAISDPQDIKKLTPQELETLCGEIRRFLIDSVSKTGGHLASNLGVVELTTALFSVFDFSEDKIVWDVGHQAYVYKMLTGRKDRFSTLRQLNGLSGYPKPKESPYDCFGAGHTSTSISAALGFAVSRDLKKEENHVIAMIGDGSMTGGLAFEALNNAGRSERDLIVVLNDNEMSISKNVGAVSRHLNMIRTAPSYLGAKRDVNRFLKGIPWFGEKVGKFIERTKDSIKYFFISGVLFEEFGFTYIGPVDGHNLTALKDVFEKAKQISGPLLIHVYTK